MNDHMHKSPHSHDPELSRFDEWLREARVKASPQLLARVRERLDEGADELDPVLDDLLRPDPRLRNPAMVQKVRQRLGADPADRQRDPFWFKWATPFAAAATLTFAFISFQNQAPRVPLPENPEGIVRATADPVDNDPGLTQIFALASNLHGSTDMTKLESVEDLAFLFD